MEVEIHQMNKFESNHDQLLLLAHDAAKETNKETELWDIRKQSLATIIYSYTSVDSFFNFITVFDKASCFSVVDKMSSDLQKRFEKFTLLEKIELFHLFKGETLNRGMEPLQSFDLLRSLSGLTRK